MPVRCFYTPQPIRTELLSAPWPRGGDLCCRTDERDLASVRLEGLSRSGVQFATAVGPLRGRRDVGVSLGVEHV